MTEAEKMGNSPNIINELYNRYFIENNQPENLVTSHWKYYHNKIEIEFADNRVKKIKGYGFGDLDERFFISRVFSWITIGSYLFQIKNKRELIRLIRIAIPIAKKMGLLFSYDCFRYVCSLNLIMSNMRVKDKKRINIINIGDGYGFLSALIKEVFPDSLICMVDLGKTLLFQAYYCGKSHPDHSHFLITDITKDMIKEADIDKCDFLYCPAEYIESLKGISFDIAINIASMQEMNENSIKAYFEFLRVHMTSDNLFYCCNREVKEMQGGEISRFYAYPWLQEDVHLIDDYCPWYKYFLSVQKAKNGPSFFKLRIPFINYFDGDILHRLTILHTYK